VHLDPCSARGPQQLPAVQCAACEALRGPQSRMPSPCTLATHLSGYLASHQWLLQTKIFIPCAAANVGVPTPHTHPECNSFTSIEAFMVYVVSFLNPRLSTTPCTLSCPSALPPRPLRKNTRTTTSVLICLLCCAHARTSTSPQPCLPVQASPTARSRALRCFSARVGSAVVSAVGFQLGQSPSSTQQRPTPSTRHPNDGCMHCIASRTSTRRPRKECTARAAQDTHLKSVAVHAHRAS
jgi:hypothetical protein